MQKRMNEDVNAVYITVDMACKLTNLGKNTVRKMARDCKATRKIGKLLRINRSIFLAYVDSFED